MSIFYLMYGILYSITEECPLSHTSDTLCSVALSMHFQHFIKVDNAWPPQQIQWMAHVAHPTQTTTKKKQ